MSPLQDGAAAVQSAAEGELHLFTSYSLADPLFLLLLPAAVLAVVWGRSRRARVAGRVAGLPAAALPRSLRQSVAWLPPVLQALAAALAVVALARPLRGNVEDSTVSEGVDIVLAVDVSSSMLLPDLVEDKSVSRFEVVSEAVLDFAVRRMTDREGNADRICLLPFAFYPRILCPFTLDVDAVRNFMATLTVVDEGSAEDGTAVGVALAKAVAVLRKTDAESKIAVLLTDGENNVHEIVPLDAAQLAKTEGIRVYTIHAGRYVWQRNLMTGGLVPTNQTPDTSELEEIARITGGRFFRARDKASLEDVYAQIEELERTPREERRYVQSFDLYPYFLEPALALYVLSWLLGATVARRLP